MANTCKTVLTVDNIRIKCFHGWYEEERITGGMYGFTVHLHGAADEDTDYSNLDHTVNYEKIYKTIVETMSESFLLIEQACKAIFTRLKEIKPQGDWEVTIIKENPPLKYVGSTQFSIRG